MDWYAKTPYRSAVQYLPKTDKPDRQIVNEGQLDEWGRWSSLWDTDKAFEFYRIGQRFYTFFKPPLNSSEKYHRSILFLPSATLSLLSPPSSVSPSAPSSLLSPPSSVSPSAPSSSPKLNQNRIVVE
ncbi:hypothetical protein LguiA_002543 [Lonicera macranthoides]